MLFLFISEAPDFFKILEISFKPSTFFFSSIAKTCLSSVDLKSNCIGTPQGFKLLITKNVPTIPNAENNTVISNITGMNAGNGKKSFPPMIIGQSIVIIPIIIVRARQVPKNPNPKAAIDNLDLL